MTHAQHPTPGSGPAPDPQVTAAQAKDAAKDVAGHGKEQAAEVAQTGKQAAAEVVDETKQQAGDLLHRTRGQLRDQVEVQQTSTVNTLRSLGDQLASMTEHTDETGTAVDVAARLRDRTRSAADWLDDRDPDQVLDDVRRFGRQRPGAFLLGAAVAGLVAGRLTRGAVDEHRDTAADAPTDSSPTAPAGRHEPSGTP